MEESERPRIENCPSNTIENLLIQIIESWLKNTMKKKLKLRFDSFAKRRLDDYRH